MEKYTIYCTKEQTTKALELGAPIDYLYSTSDYIIAGRILKMKENNRVCHYGIPTTEQMLGWLRSQGFRFRIKDLEESTHWEVTIDGWMADGELQTSKEAILATINTTLKYLSNRQSNKVNYEKHIKI